MRILSIANQKGGVGKTATAHALGVALAARYRVILLDCDPQNSLTQAVKPGDYAGRSIAEVIGSSQPGALTTAEILQPVKDNLFLAPSDIALASCELGLTTRLGRELVIKKALAPLVNRFDLVIIDCPPSLGLLTACALVAAEAVLIPTQPQAADLRGLSLFIGTVNLIKAELNPDLIILGILPTFYDNRLNHHKAAIQAMTGAGLPLLPVKIGRSVRVAEAAGAGLSIADYDPANPQTENYRQLAEVIEQWLKNKT